MSKQDGKANQATTMVEIVLLYLWPGVLLATKLTSTTAEVFFSPPGYDESELLHASWLIAHFGKMWVDVFEHHSPLFNTLNSWIFDTDSKFLAVWAKFFALSLYFAGAWLFSIACRSWLRVSPRFSASFALISAWAYIYLTWPVDIGVVRPENYSTFSLIAASLFAYRVGRGTFYQSILFSTLCGFFLVLSVSFSPRFLFLAGGVALMVLGCLPSWQAARPVAVGACFGAAIAVLLDLTVAPLSGYFLWMVEFNANLRPFRRENWGASERSIGVATLSLLLAVIALATSMAAAYLRRRAEWKPGLIGSVLKSFVDRRLFAAQLMVAICWLFVFADHAWGRQSFGGIAVASACYVAVVVANAFSVLESVTQSERFQFGRAGIATSAWGRLASVLAVLAIVTVVGRTAWSSTKQVYDTIVRFPPRGTLTDLALVRSETSFKLESADDLLPLSQARNFAEWLLWSKRYCEIFANEKILMIPTRHPICVKDASYYWYAGEHFRAMAQEPVSFVPEPPYRVIEDILAARPALIDADQINGPVGEADRRRADLSAMLNSDYRLVHSPLIGNWAWIRKNFVPHRESE